MSKVKPWDDERIRRAVRRAIVYALQEDHDGGELLLKEVWEECGSVGEVAIAKDELRTIISTIGNLPDRHAVFEAACAWRDEPSMTNANVLARAVDTAKGRS